MTNNTFKNSELGAQSHILAGQGEKNYSSHDELLARAFRDHKPVSRSADDGEDFTGLIATKSVSEGHTNVSDHTPTVGELDLEARSSLRSLTRGSEIHATDQDDGYDVEYRKLRLERVILVGVWTKGTTAEIEANMNELASLAETAGADVVEVLYQKRDKPDQELILVPARCRNSRK